MVAVVTVDLFGWLSSVDGLATTLSAIGRDVLGEDAEYGSIDQETVARLEAEWTSVIPHRIAETTSKQLWWALNNDDIESLRSAWSLSLPPRYRVPATWNRYGGTLSPGRSTFTATPRDTEPQDGRSYRTRWRCHVRCGAGRSRRRRRGQSLPARVGPGRVQLTMRTDRPSIPVSTEVVVP